MKLVIVQGKTATGKTTLAIRLAKDLGMPLLLKDSIKEEQYEELGKLPNLRQWVVIENGSWEQLFETVRAAIHNNTSLIVEGNFVPKQRKRLRKLIPSDCNVVEVFCSARGRVILKRYIKRNQSGERHKGHRDNLWYSAVFIEMALARIGLHWIKPVGISDKMIEVDTTDFSKVDYDEIKRFVRAA